jgi:hypothetical protein
VSKDAVQRRAAEVSGERRYLVGAGIEMGAVADYPA